MILKAGVVKLSLVTPWKFMEVKLSCEPELQSWIVLRSSIALKLIRLRLPYVSNQHQVNQVESPTQQFTMVMHGVSMSKVPQTLKLRTMFSSNLDQLEQELHHLGILLLKITQLLVLQIEPPLRQVTSSLIRLVDIQFVHILNQMQTALTTL